RHLLAHYRAVPGAALRRRARGPAGRRARGHRAGADRAGARAPVAEPALRRGDAGTAQSGNAHPRSRLLRPAAGRDRRRAAAAVAEPGADLAARDRARRHRAAAVHADLRGVPAPGNPGVAGRRQRAAAPWTRCRAATRLGEMIRLRAIAAALPLAALPGAAAAAAPRVRLRLVALREPQGEPHGDAR